MVKNEVIVIRIDTGTKEQLTAAAEEHGLTLTTFLVRAGLREAARSPAGGSLVHQAIREAQVGGEGYRRLGFLLARQLAQEQPAVARRLGRELSGGRGGDDAATWQRFADLDPAGLAAVPRRRRSLFLAGAREAFADAPPAG